jgi:methionyl-tRNA synthetase
METNEIPRRIRLDQNKPAELAIREAAKKIEELGADVRLTDALNFMWKAMDLVSDYIDENKANHAN